MACKEESNESAQDSNSELESLQVDSLEAEGFGSEEDDARKELALLSSRIRTAVTMLRYLRSVSEIKDLDSSSQGEEASEMLQSIEIVTDVLESLVRRVTEAESETVFHKEKAVLGEEEICRKMVQIENLSLKLEEMDGFVQETNSALDEMRVRIKELVVETLRQKEKAFENDEELCRVKREFESLKDHVSTLANVREALISSERQFKVIEELFEGLVAKSTQLEGEKAQKEVEVQKLMEENVKLTALLDKKEAQLLALNEQCKVMALSSSNI